MLHQASGGWKQHVRSDGGDHDSFDFTGVNSALRQGAFRSFRCQIARSHSLFDNVAFANTSSRSDPLFAGLDDLFEVRVGHNSVPALFPHTVDLSPPQLPPPLA